MATVLVADDKAAIRQFLATLLGYGGHRLLEAADGAEALAQVRTARPDLVITDVLMPVMDGYEFVRQLRNDPQITHTPVIFYTASYHEREARALAESCGVRHLIIKPSEPQQILATVGQALGAAPRGSPAPAPEEFDREHLRLLTDKLYANVNKLEATNQRLADLLEMSRLLASELDGEQLLAKFCPATRELIGARFAFIGVLTEGHQVLKPLFISGADAETLANIGTLSADQGLLARLSAESEPLRVLDASADPLAIGLPAPYLPTRSFLGIRLSTPARLYGLLWLLEKLGVEEFSEDDGKILVSLAAEAAVAYENAQRYREIQRHAVDLERRVKERTAELTAANTELEAFTYSVSHDLRAPLRHIAGFSKILVDEHGAQLAPEQQMYLARIQEAAVQMGCLVDDLLRLSRIGRQEVRHRIVGLDALVGEALVDLEPETTGREIEWEVGPLPVVDCDPALMKQVFVNLLSNAVKYTRPRQHARIEVAAIGESDSPVICVRDNGVGFNMKYADKLFGVFQRLHRQEEFEGTGVGLAIVQRIIHKHGGRIWADAELNRGAAFCFTLGPARTDPSKTTLPPVGEISREQEGHFG